MNPVAFVPSVPLQVHFPLMVLPIRNALTLLAFPWA
jgi:hypothetical protein